MVPQYKNRLWGRVPKPEASSSKVRLHQPPLRERSKLPPRCGKRCETKSQMKTFIHEAVECYLMGRAPYKTRAELVSALEARDPDKKGCGRERLKYHLIRVMLEMSNPPVRVKTARAAPTPPRATTLPRESPPPPPRASTPPSLATTTTTSLLKRGGVGRETQRHDL